MADPGADRNQPGQEESGSAEGDERARGVQVVGRMRDHELVDDGYQHDPGDNREMQVGVDVAADLASLLRRGRADPFRGRPGDLSEIQPPERRGGKEGEQELKPVSEAVAPASTMLSPSAMITNSWNRSPKWAPSICHWLIGVRPNLGNQ